MSRLYIKSESIGNRTAITDSFFTSPLKIAKPFYNKDFTELMMMSASAGFLDGDFFDIQLDIKKNSQLKFSGQSYTKIFKATKNGAGQKVKINVEENACFLYFPTPVIPFKNSIFRSDTKINLAENSRFAMLDIISCGRKSMGEIFCFDSYHSRTSIYIGGKLVFLDNQRLVPNEINLLSIGFFEGFSHIGMMYTYGININQPENEISGSSQATKGICTRIYGNSAEDIIRIANKIIKEDLSWLVF